MTQSIVTYTLFNYNRNTTRGHPVSTSNMLY